MERKSHSTGSIVGAVVLLVVVLVGLYVGGYFALSEYDDSSGVVRTYRYDWLAYGYRPLARVEAALTGSMVDLNGPTIACWSSGEVWKAKP